MFSHAVQFSFILTNVRGRKKDEIPEQLIKRPPGLNKNPFHPETESISMSKQYVGGTENLKGDRGLPEKLTWSLR